MSTVVLKRPETLTDEVPYRLNWACGFGVRVREGYLAEPVGEVMRTVDKDIN